MKAFIVATPLQLFNSLVIMRHFYEGEKCDLFVLNIACDMRPVISRFHALNVIDSVYYLDDVCQHQSRLGIIWDHIYITKSRGEYCQKPGIKIIRICLQHGSGERLLGFIQSYLKTRS